MNIKLEVGKKYVLRNGETARVVATDANHRRPAIALIMENGKENAAHYSLNGRYLVYSGEESPWDIISEWNPWLCVAVDAKIRVRDSVSDSWVNRHFSHYDQNTKKVNAWEWGRSSHTTENKATSDWNFAELLE